MKQLLVIVPGWGGSKKTWQNFATLASDYFDVEVIDLPCFGDERCPESVWGIEEYAAFVKNKLSAHNDREVLLLGHSFGGQVAAYLVSHNAGICKKLILSGAAIIRKRHTLKSVIFKIAAFLGNVLFSLPLLSELKMKARKLLYRAADSPDYLDTFGIKRDIFKKVIRQNILEDIKNIKIPTLIIWGEKDTYTPLRHGKQIAHSISGAKFVILKDGTHGLHLNQTLDFLNHIREFAHI